MIYLKNIRRGVVVVPGARLRFGPGEVKELGRIDRELDRAVELGLLVRVERVADLPARVPDDGRVESRPTVESPQIPGDLPPDLLDVRAPEAIARVEEEDDVDQLGCWLEAERRRGVKGAIRKRLEELGIDPDELVAALRADLGDGQAELFADSELQRFIYRAVFRLRRDLDLDLGIDSLGNIVPEPDGEASDLLVLLGQIYACEQMRARSATSFSFQSGDKRVDKTRQAESWADLEKDLWAQYRSRLGQISPGADPDSGLLTPGGFRPVIYEQGKNH